LQRIDRALLKGIFTCDRIELENPPIVVNPEKDPEVYSKLILNAPDSIEEESSCSRISEVSQISEVELTKQT